jgi:hypothetical protein
MLSSLKFHLTRISSNVKTGPIPVSTSSRATCPDSCPFKANGCYADNYGLNFLWNSVTNGSKGISWQAFCQAVAKLPKGTLWRHNQAGDLPHTQGRISRRFIDGLIAANSGRRGFTYTHHNLAIGENQALIKKANRQGLTVNVSTESEAAADQAIANGLPAVMVVPSDEQRASWRTPAGNAVLICPAQRSDDRTCADCGLCQKRGRKVIIGFIAHGTRSARVDAALGA